MNKYEEQNGVKNGKQKTLYNLFFQTLLVQIVLIRVCVLHTLF